MTARPAGREAKRLPYEFCRYIGAISMITVGDGFPVPFSTIGTTKRYRAAKAVTTRMAPCTNCLSALPTRAGQGSNDHNRTMHAFAVDKTAVTELRHGGFLFL